MRNEDDNTRVIIRDRHDNIVLVELNGGILFEVGGDGAKEKAEVEEKILLDGMTGKDVWNFSMNTPLEELEFIMEAVELNKKISAEGLRENYGLKVASCVSAGVQAPPRALP